MRPEEVQEICERFALGAPRGSARAVTGGLLHRIWRVETDSGAFAVKVLNPRLMQRPGIREVYRASERVASRAAAAGLPALAARPCDGDPVQDLAAGTVLVFDWVAGRRLGSGPSGAGPARRMGELLARLHALDLDAAGFDAPGSDVTPASRWRDLVDRGRAAGLGWARSDLADELARLGELAASAGRSLCDGWVLSHRDLDQKNVLWREDGSPVLLDWEGVGLCSPAVELAAMALCWSGALEGPTDPASFEAVGSGYVDAGGSLRSARRDALVAALQDRLHWLEHCMDRSLNGVGFDRDVGVREADREIERIRRVQSLIG